MKHIVWAVVIVVCFVLGRIMYAPLGPALLASKGEAAIKPGSDTPTVVFGTTSKGLSITIDLKSVSSSEIPARVKLKKKALVAADDGSNKTPLAAGDEVSVIEQVGGNLLVSAGGPLQGRVPIEHTDFAERVIEVRVAKIFSGAVPAVAQNTPPAPGPGPGPDPGPSPDPAPIPAPGPGPAPVPPVVADNPPPAPDPAPDAEPAPDPEPAPAGGRLTPEQIVEAMKASIKAGDIKEFTLEQVQEWMAGEDENIDGETYQIGLASYLAKTIFGEKLVQAKALLKDGKVQKWLYSKTNMEIH